MVTHENKGEKKIGSLFGSFMALKKSNINQQTIHLLEYQEHM